MKKIIVSVAAIVIAASLSACGGNSGGGSTSYDTYRPAETTTTAPIIEKVSNKTMELNGVVGKYTGEINDSGIPDGEGYFITSEVVYGYEVAEIIDGDWKSGDINNGTYRVTVSGETMGSTDIVNGNADQDTIQAILEGTETWLNQKRDEDEWEKTKDKIKDVGSDILEINEFGEQIGLW